MGQANDGVQVALREQMLLEPGLHAFAEQGSVREHHRRNTTRAKQADEQREEQVSRLTGAQMGGEVALDPVLFLAATGRIGEDDIDATLLLPAEDRKSVV